jgi:hypothetical protein
VVIGNRGAVAACEKEYVARFPHLKGVRDSVQHMEASGRGLDKNEKPLKLKPIDNSMIHAPQGGVLALNSLNNNVFGTTMNDGSCGEVEVRACYEPVRRMLVACLRKRQANATK